MRVRHGWKCGTRRRGMPALGIATLALVCLGAGAEAAAGQVLRPGLYFPNATPPPATALRIYLDCARCDQDYLRTEVPFIDYVRDRRDADVHILVTTQPAGAGVEYTLAFIGLGDLTGRDVTLRFLASQTDTADEIRRTLASRLKVGLVPYLADTPLIDRLDVVYESDQPAMTRPEDDPWQFWVFRGTGEADLSGEESQRFLLASGSLSANRTTDTWKIRMGARGTYDRDEFELDDGNTFTNQTRSWDATGLVVRSLGDHWGVGAGASAIGSTFRNLRLALRAAPAIEYNVFPYGESTRRQLTLAYAIGVNRFDYEDPTIFGRVSDTLTDQTVTISFDARQPWGQSSLSLEGAQFLDDPGKYRVVATGNLEFRVTRGLSFQLFGSSSLLRDQIFLPLRGSSTEEILLRRRQLATDFDYAVSFGVTYTFGSIFNNVVNSRFAGSSGGVIRRF